jgi:hypothetical protein
MKSTAHLVPRYKRYLQQQMMMELVIEPLSEVRFSILCLCPVYILKIFFKMSPVGKWPPGRNIFFAGKSVFLLSDEGYLWMLGKCQVIEKSQLHCVQPCLIPDDLLMHRT